MTDTWRVQPLGPDVTDPAAPGPDPTASSAAVSARMRKQRRSDTVPELALRRLLHARGYRCRLVWPVPGRSRRSIDIAFPGRRIAVFVDGCFWHSCPEHATRPRANSAWWSRKLERNVQRDRETDSLLTAEGWIVVRIWEHERPQDALARVQDALHARSGIHRTTSRR